MQNSFLTFFFWRIALFIPIVIGLYLIPYREGQSFTNIYSRVDSASLLDTALLFPWTNFDGVHYVYIAGYGYTNEARFFPLFPIVINLISNMLGGGTAFSKVQIITAVILASTLFLFALQSLRKLLELDFSKEVVGKTIFYLVIFPTSFFFVCVYSESLFLLLALLSFYFARKDQWILATFFGALLMVTRFVGIVILPALIYEFVTSNYFLLARKNWYELIKMMVLFLTMPIGLILYALFNYIKFGNFFYFISAQGEVANYRTVNSIILFPQTIVRYIRIFASFQTRQYEWWVALLEIAFFIFVSIILYLGIKKKLRPSYMIFTLLGFLMPVSSGTFSGLPRYVIVLFPVFVILSVIKNKFFRLAYIIVSPLLLFILLMFFSRGYFVA